MAKKKPARGRAVGSGVSRSGGRTRSTAKAETKAQGAQRRVAAQKHYDDFVTTYKGAIFSEEMSAGFRALKDPSTGLALVCLQDTPLSEIQSKLRSAKKVQDAWNQIPCVEKALWFHRFAQNLREQGSRIASVMTLETGKPLCESLDCIEWVAACFDYYAEVGRASRGLNLPPVAHDQLAYTVKEPLGVVAAIVPFNFPLLLMSWKLAPALMAGNTVVAKPPHQNPVSSLMVLELLQQVLPPHVVEIVVGHADVAQTLVKSPLVDCIAFTGSTAVGREIARDGGYQLKRLNLELGGIDPLVVFSDADVDHAAKAASWARLLNAGQVCTSSKRFYVVKSVYEDFMDALLREVKKVRMGDPFDQDTDMGPLITLQARERVVEQVQRLKKEKARLVYGGEIPRLSGPLSGGYFMEPTVFTNVKHGGMATTEEIFGPVINVICVKDDDEAIALANDSNYGLGAVVFTQSLKTSMKAAASIKAGTFWVNDPLTDNDAGPFGGMRWSGIGRELGQEGLDAFRDVKHVHLEYVPTVKNFWFPYSQRKLEVSP